MTNLSDKIISVFLDKHVLTLKDSEISLALVAQGIPLYTEEVRRYAQSLSPALFQLLFNKDSSMTIQVDPRVIHFLSIHLSISIEFRSIFADHFLPVVVIIV